MVYATVYTKVLKNLYIYIYVLYYVRTDVNPNDVGTMLIKGTMSDVGSIVAASLSTSFP